MQNEPDFIFNLNIPVNEPSNEEVDMISPHLESYLQALVDSGYLTSIEAVAFVKFTSELGSFVPFMMDSFLQSYRNSQSEKSRNSIRSQLEEDAEIARNAAPKIIT